MSDAPVLRMEAVRFAYHHGKRVIDGVSLAALPGRVHMLLGPNASGKSTILKLMLGLLRPAGGQVLLDDRRVRRHRARRRAAWMSYVPQRSGASFAFTVRQVVTLGRYAMDHQPGAIDQALALCDLGGLADAIYAELSVGQQQRVLLARAVAQASGQGRVMLLDEPTSAMDLAHVHHTMTLLRRLAAEGLAIVAVVQDINLAARYADDVWLLQQGRCAAQGTWDQVLTPEVLEPVYRVQVRSLVQDDQAIDRPVLDVRLPGPTDQRYNPLQQPTD